MSRPDPRDPFADGDVATWFLGPMGENAGLLERLLAAAVRSAAKARRDFHPEDIAPIDAATQDSPQYRAAARRLQDAAEDLFVRLRASEPFASMRYHGHMNWDAAMPGLVGYAGAMLFNQNNCGAEGSPVTTRIEIAVAAELCRMVGFPESESRRPWGHITSGGTVANIEGLWALREARFRPAAVAAALRGEAELADARSLETVLPDGRSARLLDLDPWALCTLTLEAALDLTDTIVAEHGLPRSRVAELVRGHALSGLGWLDFHAGPLHGETAAPVVLVPASAHYSWPKAATVLGFGAQAVRLVPLDADGRMDVAALAAMLEQAEAERRPATVVAVAGSTELGAVDPLDAILALREARRRAGNDFGLHADAAWGGYFATLLRPAPETDGAEGPLSIPGPVPQAGLKPCVAAALAALGAVDTLTVDPHKAGYVPYPAGALLHRDSRLRDLVSLAAPVVFHGDAEPTIGTYGLEGSKPGAAAAAVQLCHRVIGLHEAGYGKLLGQCLWTSKRIFLRLATLHRRLDGADFRVIPVQRTPAEAAGADAAAREAELDRMARLAVLDTASLRARLADCPEDAALFRAIGSDLLVLGFAVTRRGADGQWTRRVHDLNALTDAIFERCSYRDSEARKLADVEVIFTSSQVSRPQAGDAFVAALAARLGIEDPGKMPVHFLIATAMNPWATDDANAAEPEAYDHFARIEAALARAVAAAPHAEDAR